MFENEQCVNLIAAVPESACVKDTYDFFARKKRQTGTIRGQQGFPHKSSK